MAKDVMKKEIKTLKNEIDAIIRDYEEVPFGCGYNIGAEARRKNLIEKLERALEENDMDVLEEYLSLKKVG